MINEDDQDEVLSFVALDVHSGQRADKVLSALCADLSRSRLQDLIAQGMVFLDHAVLSTPSTKVEAGQVFLVQVPPPVEGEPKAEDIPLDVVYEDDDVLVINKPAGMVVHPGAGHWSGTLVNALLHHCGESLSGIGGVVRPGIVHRLDKDTSGLMMVAKNDFAHHHLSAQLADRSLSRVYHALVLGVPMPIKGSVDRPIGRHKHNRLKMSVMSGSLREAKTYYRVVEQFGQACALVECVLETGRTHQIRVHMEAIGYPILGDSLYGPQRTALQSNLKKESYSIDIINEILSLPYQMLHARALQFIHPRTEEVQFFECKSSEIFSKALKLLKK